MKPNFEINADTALITQHLMSIEVGSDVSYINLAQVIGRKDIDGSNPQLQSALRKCRKNGVHFDNIRGIGYRRMTDSEVVKASERDVSRTRKAAKRYATRIGSVDYERLSSDDKDKFNTSLTVLGFVSQVTGKKATNLIAMKVSEMGKRLPISSTMKLFE